MRLLVVILTLLAVCSCVPASPHPQTKQTQAEVHYKLGVAHLQANNPTLALKEFLLAVEKNPQDSSIQVALAQAYQMKGAYPEAEQHYLKALELSHDDPRYQNNLASLYLDMEQWDKAISYFDKAASNLLFTRPHVALSGKGYAYFRKQQYQKALEQYRLAVKMAPIYAPAYYLQSEVYRKLGQPEDERRVLERAVEIAPNFVQANYRLGVLCYEDKQYAAAEKHLQVVYQQTPDSEIGQQAIKLIRSLPQP